MSGCSTSTQPASTASATPRSALIHLPAHPRVYFIGDSWTHGYSADPGHGFPSVVARTLGWDLTVAPDGSGAGFTHTWDPDHPVFPDFVKTLPPIDADLIVLEGGLNDENGDLQKEWVSVQSTIRTLRAKSKGAPVIVVGMAAPSGTPAEADGVIDHDMGGAAAAESAPYISPLTEKWITPSNAGLIIDAKTGHPSTAGHAYYGARLAADLQELVSTD